MLFFFTKILKIVIFLSFLEIICQPPPLQPASQGYVPRAQATLTSVATCRQPPYPPSDYSLYTSFRFV